MNKLNKIWVVAITALSTHSFVTASEVGESSELSLEKLLDIEVVESTGFFAGDEKKNPGYLNIIDMDEIDLGPQRTLRDILEKKAPSFYMVRHHNNGDALGVRGFAVNNSSKTMVMQDGMNLNLRYNGGYFLGFRSPLMGDTSRIEVANSPSALVHGSGAIFGFVNSVSKNGQDYQGLELSAERGNVDGSRSAEVSYGHAFSGDTDLFFYAGVHDADGFIPSHVFEEDYEVDPNQSKVRAVGSPNKKISSLFRSGQFEFKLYYSDINATPDSIQINKARYMHFEQFGSFIKYDWNMTPYETLVIDTSGLISDYGFHKDFMFDSADQEDEYDGGGEQYVSTKLIQKTTRFNDHNLAIGTQIVKRQFLGDQWKLSSEELEGDVSSPEGSWLETSYFAEDVWSITDKIAITSGIRFDALRNATIDEKDIEDGENIVKRGGIAYLWNEDTTFKLSYQEGFRFPDASNYSLAKKEIVGYDEEGDEIFERRNIKPESSESIELNASFGRAFNINGLSMDLNLFRNKNYDSIKWDKRHSDEPKKIGQGWINADEEVETLGGEFIVNFDVDRYDLNSYFSFSYAENRSDLDIWQFFPEKIFKAGFSKGFLGNRLVWVNDFYLDHGFGELKHGVDEDAWLDKRSSWDTAINYNVNNSMKVKVAAQNVTEETGAALNVQKWRAYNGNLGSEKRIVYGSLDYQF